MYTILLLWTRTYAIAIAAPMLVHVTCLVYQSTWAVVGAGPCGIASVGYLLDKGYTVTWIDNSHTDIGRLGLYYRNVPANTPNSVLIHAMQTCQSYSYKAYIQYCKQQNRLCLEDFPKTDCCKLEYLVDALESASLSLRNHENSTVITGCVHGLTGYTDSPWKLLYRTDNFTQELNVSGVILAVGAKPLLPYNIPANSPHQNLDLFVDPLYVKDYMTNPKHASQSWAVVGSSHSAMLVVKNLLEAGASRVVNFYRSNFIFEEILPDGTYINRGSGLKGPVGNWVKQKMPSYRNLERIRLTDDTSLEQHIKRFSERVIYAVGYRRIDNVDICFNGKYLSSDDIDMYDKNTGEIIPDGRIYGIGIGFPQNYIDGLPWVGFNRCYGQLDEILNIYEKRL